MNQKHRNELIGIATPDPTATPGWKLFVHPRLLRVERAPKHGPAPLTIFGGLMMTVSFRDGLHHETFGSAVPVGPGLAICASHVIADYMQRVLAGAVSITCEAITHEGLLFWQVEYITSIPNTDLTLLSMTLRSSIPAEGIGLAFMSTRMPRVGEELFIGGFRALGAAPPISNRIHMKGDTWFSRGKVLDVFANGADRVMMPGPGLAVDCPALGGMSGGPVFDSRGYLIGILTASIAGDSAALVSHIWPALTQTAPIVWPKNRRMPKEASLLYLGHSNAVSIERPDAFSVDAQNGQMVFRYTQWG